MVERHYLTLIEELIKLHLYRDGSDEVLYKTSIHATEGIPCRNKGNLEKICLLPNNQRQNEGDLCSIGKKNTSASATDEHVP